MQAQNIGYANVQGSCCHFATSHRLSSLLGVHTHNIIQQGTLSYAERNLHGLEERNLQHYPIIGFCNFLWRKETYMAWRNMLSTEKVKQKGPKAISYTLGSNSTCVNMEKESRNIAIIYHTFISMT